MKQPIKAVLLSAFVYPGAGHLLLKRYVSCVVLIAGASAVFYILVSNALTKAMLISNKIINGVVEPDIAVIRNLISDLQSAEEVRINSIATVFLIIVWLIGIIDSYRVGCAQDRNALTVD